MVLFLFYFANDGMKVYGNVLCYCCEQNCIGVGSIIILNGEYHVT